MQALRYCSNKIIMNCGLERKCVDEKDCNLFNVATNHPHEKLLLTAIVTRDLRNANKGSALMIYFTTLSVSKTK
jgi:hypothetical protein